LIPEKACRRHPRNRVYTHCKGFFNFFFISGEKTKKANKKEWLGLLERRLNEGAQITRGFLRLLHSGAKDEYLKRAIARTLAKKQKATKNKSPRIALE